MSEVVPESYVRKIESTIRSTGYEMSDRVREAFQSIPRSLFVLPKDRKRAYYDQPLHILSGQTISAPSMYALMISTDIGNPQPNMKVLEIGTGSGYGAALLAFVVGESNTYTIERHRDLVDFATNNLKNAGLTGINIIHDNGTENIPNIGFDRIFVTACGDRVPDIYFSHLNPGGRIVIPLVNDRGEQWIWKITKDENSQIKYQRKMQVIFVPLIYKEKLEEFI